MNFSFHADFKFCADSSRNITAEAHEQYFGLVLTARALDEKVFVGLKDLVATSMGRGARKMREILLAFPQFWDPMDMVQRMIGR